MNEAIVTSENPVVLLGAGELTPGILSIALSLAGDVVAADGGARAALAAGRAPVAVIGDLDSIDASTRARIPAGLLVHVPDQSTTDFEKCMARIAAPLVVAAGFTGARLDHTLAVMNGLVRRAGPPCLVLGPEDLCFALPPRIALTLAPGTRVSLFPMARVRARSEGLRWPIDKVRFAPDGAVGTSNEALGGTVAIDTDGPGLLALLPLTEARQVAAALVQTAGGAARAAERSRNTT